MSTIIVNSNQINFKIEGEGEEVLVFIHGICSEMSVWDKQVEFFSSNYKIVRFDWKDHGSSKINIPETRFDVETMARELSHVLEKLNVNMPCYIIAADLGALVALKAEIDEIVQCKGIIGVNFADKMKIKPKYKIWRNLMDNLNLSMNEKLKRQEIFGKIKQSTVETWLQGASSANFEHESPYINTPVDFLYAEGNPFVTLKEIEASVSRIPNSRVFTLEKGGFFPMIADPVTFSVEIKNFIEKYIPTI
ncbi:MAG: alpha/beta fold hydrolase [Candidatus Hodarchaeota archaeon]